MESFAIDADVRQALLGRINTDDPGQLVYLQSDPLLALAHHVLFFPTVEAYRGGFFWKTSVRSKGIIDQWFAKEGLDARDVERICNRVDVAYLFSSDQSADLLWSVADTLRKTWDVWLPLACQTSVDVELFSADDLPTVTFSTAR
jgi:hypothetical protein